MELYHYRGPSTSGQSDEPAKEPVMRERETEAAALTHKAVALQILALTPPIVIVLFVLAMAFAPEKFGQYQRIDEPTLKRDIMFDVNRELAKIQQPAFQPPPRPVEQPPTTTEPIPQTPEPDRLMQLQELVGTVSTLQQTLDDLRKQLKDPQVDSALDRIEAKLTTIDRNFDLFLKALRIHADSIDRINQRIGAIPTRPQRTTEPRSVQDCVPTLPGGNQ